MTLKTYSPVSAFHTQSPPPPVADTPYPHLLREQIAAHLSDDLAAHPEVRALLKSISRTYRQQVPPPAGLSAAELTRTYNLFHTLLANMHSGILIENDQRQVLFCNDRLCKLFNLEKCPEELSGADTSQYFQLKKNLFHRPEETIRSMDRVLRKRKSVENGELEMIDGTIIKWNYLPVFVEGFNNVHFWEFEDVTEQTRYQQRLAESEERNGLVMNASLDAIIIANHDREIQYWNPRAEALFGWTPAEALGQRMNELLHPHAVSETLSHHSIPYPEKDLSPILNRVLEFTAVKKCGEEFPVELIVVPFQQHGKTFYCKFVKDISHRKETENRLRAQEEWYRNIIANMKLGLVELGKDETILGTNQGFLTMCGYTHEEIVGDTFHKLMPSKEELEIIRAKQVHRAAGLSDNYEFPILNKAGETRWWLVSASPNYNKERELLGSVGIVLDITEQKKMEADLARSKTKAEHASLAKEAFLANMSHEIRTPLNAIIGMIRELGREKLTSKQQSYLGHTDTAARHLLSIVNSILDISKIEAGEMELEEADFSLEAVVDNIQSILHVKAADKNLELSVKLDPALWPAYWGDSARFRQILLNLLDNSIKFTEQGSVRLEVEVVNETAATQSLRISLLDTGIGMDEGYLQDIFSKFSQAEKSISRRFGGTGLGMSITKEIIRLMGGGITVTSEKGCGTQFVIDVSLTKGQLERLSPPDAVNDRILEGAHLLLVEDNLMNRFIAKKSLTHFGCTVDEAENGRVALERLKERDYDIVLMDIQMPELDSVETTKIIREELRLDVPIIAVTANAFKQDIDRYLSIGMNDYVTKPFEESLLFDTLARHLHTRAVLPPPRIVDNYDLTQLEALSRGDESFVRSMVELFVEHTPPPSGRSGRRWTAGIIPPLPGPLTGSSRALTASASAS